MLVALTQQQDGLIPQLLTKMNVDPGTFETAAAEKSFPAAACDGFRP